MILTDKVAEDAEKLENLISELGMKNQKLTEGEQWTLYTIIRTFETDETFRAAIETFMKIYSLAITSGEETFSNFLDDFLDLYKKYIP